MRLSLASFTATYTTTPGSTTATGTRWKGNSPRRPSCLRPVQRSQRSSSREPLPKFRVHSVQPDQHDFVQDMEMMAGFLSTYLEALRLLRERGVQERGVEEGNRGERRGGGEPRREEWRSRGGEPRREQWRRGTEERGVERGTEEIRVEEGEPRSGGGKPRREEWRRGTEERGVKEGEPRRERNRGERSRGREPRREEWRSGGGNRGEGSGGGDERCRMKDSVLPVDREAASTETVHRNRITTQPGTTDGVLPLTPERTGCK
ncbi:hypothetical protein F7725_008761 [Dissostichus mawsoni]|uniref:Uncharacterized protein n=1 Tax=Dissostichus mawsoni TaxID=36200 RepID=A0A7J5YB88_DISMA|nr:hypothetical protein F7725_008761 [Dissostichus mawsoni]